MVQTRIREIMSTRTTRVGKRLYEGDARRPLRSPLTETRIKLKTKTKTRTQLTPTIVSRTKHLAAVWLRTRSGAWPRRWNWVEVTQVDAWPRRRMKLRATSAVSRRCSRNKKNKKSSTRLMICMGGREVLEA